jgi:hypothetical protein
MAFHGQTHKLTMFGFDASVPLADGLEIVDGSGKLATLTLIFTRPTDSQWRIFVDGTELSGTKPFSVQREAKEWVLSVELRCGTNNSGDPKIKVIRPNM